MIQLIILLSNIIDNRKEWRFALQQQECAHNYITAHALNNNY